MDDTYQIYINRVARMTLPEAYQSQVQYLQPSPKYQRQPEGSFLPTPFPGYTIITPPAEDDADNQAFYQQLSAFQQQIVAQLSPEFVIPVPPASLHMTLADLIWADAYHHASENPNFEPQLRDRIAQSFAQCRTTLASKSPIYWQALGVLVMPRAIGVCLAPKDEASYEQILHLRRAIYQNQDLIGLGVEQQYHFTAHVTLGYFGEAVAEGDRETLVQTLNQFTQQWVSTGTAQTLWIHRAELRKFDDMTRYYRSPDFPVLEF